VIILSGNPTRIFSVIDISLLFPRDPFDPLYLEKEIEIKNFFLTRLKEVHQLKMMDLLFLKFL